ncbi:MAG: hypothetical protein ACK5Z4_04215, partial [Planctomyces sp.]
MNGITAAGEPRYEPLNRKATSSATDSARYPNVSRKSSPLNLSEKSTPMPTESRNAAQNEVPIA